MRHGGGKRPSLRSGIENHAVLAPQKHRVVFVQQGATRDQQAAVRQKFMSGTEKIERLTVRCAQRLGFKKIGFVRCGRSGIPDGAEVDIFGFVAEVRAFKAFATAAGTGKEQHFAFGQHGRMNCEHVGVKFLQLPTAVFCRIMLQVEHLIETCILLRRIVHHHREQLQLAVERRYRNAGAFVFP